jgi:hypothetical protein
MARMYHGLQGRQGGERLNKAVLGPGAGEDLGVRTGECTNSSDEGEYNGLTAMRRVDQFVRNNLSGEDRENRRVVEKKRENARSSYRKWATFKCRSETPAGENGKKY